MLMLNKNQFKFAISLSVLNHLGRNLYRNFITVLGEAISNSWDADANNVWIYIDKENNNFVIKDDGIGMDAGDFQDKFLLVGYRKRKSGDMFSPKKRPYIGAKGIGKLALLSCAEKISVITKTSKTDYVGGVVDNADLDKAIERETEADQYPLGGVNLELFKQYIENHSHGTIIHFQQAKEDIRSTIPHLKKLIALYFRFSLISSDFSIFLNDEKVTLDDLKDLSDSTEFLWNINNSKDPFINTLTKIEEHPIDIKSSLKFSGFISSVEYPKNLKITGTEEKVGIDLFVNGRLREKDLLKHIPTAQIPESYLYGQIHYDELDQDGIDRFTSSREGVVASDEKYQALLKELKVIIFKILDEWDDLRLSRGKDGDDENIKRKGLKERKAGSLYNLSSKDFIDPGDDDVANLIKELRPDAEFNIPSYVNCFLSENLLRKHIEGDNLIPNSCLKIDQRNGNTCEDRYNPQIGNTYLCEYCKGQRGKLSLAQQKTEAGTSIQIRQNEDNLLMYLDYTDLTKIIDDKILKNEDKPYKPLRNSVMHTARLTEEAKTKLTSVFDNVVATVKSLVKSKSKQPSK